MVSGAHHNNVTGCLHWRGDISYPIYLIHVGMIFAIDALGGRGWQALLSNIVLTLALAALLHYLIENPSRRWGRAWCAPEPAR